MGKDDNISKGHFKGKRINYMSILAQKGVRIRFNLAARLFIFLASIKYVNLGCSVI